MGKGYVSEFMSGGADSRPRENCGLDERFQAVERRTVLGVCAPEIRGVGS